MSRPKGSKNIIHTDCSENFDEQILLNEHKPHVPELDALYVSFGFFNDLKNIIKSEIFYPVYIVGLSGNGKTTMVEQVCAATGRELMRVNITEQTDEDDLFGGFRLVNGETVWYDGPVVKAMEQGSVLLLDEVDLGRSPCMCLQPVLEGKGLLLKKINRYVKPKKGFNIIATANTKGQGDESGKFIGAGVLNEAFLERFPLTVEQEYPTVSIEKKILGAVFDFHKIENEEFVDNLTKWADVVRKSYFNGGVNEIITTRRLVHIANAFAIFNDEQKAIQLCVNRFDQNTKEAFLDMYSKLTKPKEEPVVQEELTEKSSLDDLPELEPIF